SRSTSSATDTVRLATMEAPLQRPIVVRIEGHQGVVLLAGQPRREPLLAGRFVAALDGSRDASAAVDADGAAADVHAAFSSAQRLSASLRRHSLVRPFGASKAATTCQ